MAASRCQAVEFVLSLIEDAENVRMRQVSESRHVPTECFGLDLREMRVAVEPLHGDDLVPVNIPGLIDGRHPTSLVQL